MKKSISGKLLALLFCMAALLSVMTTWRASGHLLDSDASSELVLAEHLAETGRILSEDWYYSTELRVLNTQLVFAPLFHIFDDWRLIRFTGAVILQGILIASYGFFVRCAKLSRRDFLLGGAMLLIPASVTYGRVVLWHSYYVPHIAFGFAIVGLFLRTIRNDEWISGVLLVIVSFLSGLGGVRQGVITHAPLAALTFLYMLTKGKNGVKPFVWAIAAGVGALSGLIVNSTVLSELYKFNSYGKTHLSLQNIGKWEKVAKGLLHQFGYRTGTLGWMTILSGVCAAAGLVICALALGRALKPAGEEKNDEYIVSRFFPAVAGVLACIFLLTSFSSPNEYVLYWTPAAVWVVPMLLVMKRGWIRKLSVVIISIMIISGLANSGFVFMPDRFTQSYEGLKSFKEPKAVEKLREPVELLRNEGYTIGYAPFWLGNLLTEMTNGEIDTVTIEGTETASGYGIKYRKWLTLKNMKDQVGDRAFAIVLHSWEKLFQDSAGAETIDEIYRNDVCIIYDIPDVAAFKEIVKTG